MAFGGKLQKQINDLNNKHSVLNKKVAELEGNTLHLEERVDHLEGQNKYLKEDIGDLKKENKDLKEDVGALKRDIEQLKLDDKGPLLLLGELCFQIPFLIYQKVIPQWHNKSYSYNFQDIEDDITALGAEQGENSQILAQKTWAELKKELNWEGRYARELKRVRHVRNNTAHPPIDEELLCKAAKEAKENDNLNNHTYNNVVELIGIWKKLNNIKRKAIQLN